MINKKVSTIGGSLIILAIVIALGFVLFSNQENMKIKNETISNNSAPSNDVKPEEEWVLEDNNNNKGENKNLKNDSNNQNYEGKQSSEMIATGEFYKNNKYGFEFKSPQDLFLRSNSNEDNIIFSDKPDGHWVFQISIYENSKNLSIGDVISEEIKKSNYSLDIKDINIDNRLSKKITKKDYHDYGSSMVVILNKNIIVKISGDDSIKQAKKNFEALLSSFIFIK